MKRVFGMAEAIFDICYLSAALMIASVLLFTSAGNPLRILAGVMAFILAMGDSFHLIARIAAILTHQEEKYRAAMGRGKQITSVTMTLFYVLLWHIGAMLIAIPHALFWYAAVFALAAIRIVLCLFPQNKWYAHSPPVSWGIIRNIPFFLLGLLVAVLFFLGRNAIPGLSLLWLAILLSFAFYLPVVLWSNKNRKIGMLMLPKSCAYIWILAMCFSL